MREIERKKERERERFPPHPHPQVTKEREGKAMCFLGNREQLGKKGEGNRGLTSPHWQVKDWIVFVGEGGTLTCVVGGGSTFSKFS